MNFILIISDCNRCINFKASQVHINHSKNVKKHQTFKYCNHETKQSTAKTQTKSLNKSKSKSTKIANKNNKDRQSHKTAFKCKGWDSLKQRDWKIIGERSKSREFH